jgi:hypothetical protein
MRFQSSGPATASQMASVRLSEGGQIEHAATNENSRHIDNGILESLSMSGAVHNVVTGIFRHTVLNAFHGPPCWPVLKPQSILERRSPDVIDYAPRRDAVCKVTMRCSRSKRLQALSRRWPTFYLGPNPPAECTAKT